MWRLIFVAIGFTLILLALTNCAHQHESSLTHIPYQPTTVDPPVLSGVPAMQIPADNPLTEEGIALGRRLFYDPILSKDSTISCGTCHQQARGFTDGKALSNGFDNRASKRSAMSLANVGFHSQGLFWDGRVATLEAQAIHPVQDTLEMNLEWVIAEDRLRHHSEYPILFRKTFGIERKEQITKDLIIKVLAQFERTLISKDSKFDRFKRGEVELTAAEARGFTIFFDTSAVLPHSECAHCHIDPLFSTLEYLNNGIQEVQELDDFPDKGRGAVTSNRYENGAFKVPTLRNIAQIAPYMHDGRFKTLDEVLDHYISGGHFAENLNPNVRKLHFSERDKQDLIAFLNTLTDSVFLQNPAFGNPFYQQ